MRRGISDLVQEDGRNPGPGGQILELVHADVYSTHERLLDHIRYVLWDEVPSDISRPANPYDDFLVV